MSLEGTSRYNQSGFFDLDDAVRGGRRECGDSVGDKGRLPLDEEDGEPAGEVGSGLAQVLACPGGQAPGELM